MAPCRRAVGTAASSLLEEIRQGRFFMDYGKVQPSFAPRQMTAFLPQNNLKWDDVVG